jgi:hypothetical protein
MKGSMPMEENTGLVLINGMMVLNIRESGKKIKYQALVFIRG